MLKNVDFISTTVTEKPQEMFLRRWYRLCKFIKFNYTKLLYKYICIYIYVYIYKLYIYKYVYYQSCK